MIPKFYIIFDSLNNPIGAALIFASGVALEYTGVATGVPFGRYRYTGVLVPSLPGGVPLAMGFAWLFIVVCGLFTARRLFGRVLTGLPLALAGAALALGLDLLLEPVAYRVKGYWQWLDPGPGAGYYGVPWSNFAAWFAAALVMNRLLVSFIGGEPAKWTWLPAALYVMNVVLFAMVDLAHGLWAPALIGLLLLGALWVGWLSLRK